MIVLSLFDGCGMAYQALKNLNIKVEKYYASEIDKYAIKVALKNHPDIIELGDINNWESWNIDCPDLIIGGSPCQGFSFAGKQLNFEDPRSRLYFKFEEILKHYNPEYWVLENVRMKDEIRDIISKRLDVKPVLINSSLVSAQNRKRYYWSNIKINQPADKNILLKDIIENGEVDKEKSYCLDSSYYKGSKNGELYLQKSRRQIVVIENKTILHNLYNGFKENFPRIFKDKSPTIRTSGGGGHIPSVFLKWCFIDKKIILKNRLLAPVECERLQTLPDNYTLCELVSNTQRYKMLGNGFTIKVIEHILSKMI